MQEDNSLRWVEGRREKAAAQTESLVGGHGTVWEELGCSGNCGVLTHLVTCGWLFISGRNSGRGKEMRP